MNIQSGIFHSALVILGLLLAWSVVAFRVSVESLRHGPEENYFSAFLFICQWMFIEAKSAPFAACAFLCFLVSGFFWYRAAGQKKIFCYLLFLWFALMVGFGSMFYEATYIATHGDAPLEEPSRSIFWQLLGAGILAHLLIEALARWLYRPEK